jgi:[protein-PII] uridylyltransferase
MPPALQRSALLDDRSLSGRAFCASYGELIESWLVEIFDEAVAGAGGAGTGVTLVAIGGQGRKELCPQSDLDLLLLLGKGADGDGIAEKLWYPIWDAGLKLGHSVRSVRDTLSLASEDLETATSLLSTRHLAGDRSLSAELEEKARVNWRKKGRKWLEELALAVQLRHDESGEVAFELEPDLKEGRGGLRDVHALGWARAAGADVDERLLADLQRDHDTLLGVRIELHRATAKPGDRLLLQEQDAVAAALGDVDADALMARVAAAGRAIAWASDESWHEIKLTLNGAFFGRFRKERRLEGDLVLRDARICLADESSPVTDPTTVLRVALAAARQSARIGLATLGLLEDAPPLPEPWPDEARRLFTELLLTGPAAIGVIETLDQRGLWEPLIPEWAPNHSRPQRNAYHRFTVDRHLLETASEAAGLGHRTPRPDLLVMSALLHDMGKGYPQSGDHSVVGEELAGAIAARMGFAPEDVSTIQAAVRHHLLLPDVATRRDLDDPATIEFVAREVQTTDRLALLRALTEADSIATGPAAWGPWKAQLVEQLAARTAHLLDGGRVEDIVTEAFPSDAQRALMGAGVLQVLSDGEVITVVCPDRPGTFFRVAGALALHGLDVTGAAIHTEAGMALDEFRVRAGASDVVAWDRVRDDVERVLEGRVALQARLDERARNHRRRHRPGLHQLAQLVRFDNEFSTDATVIEVVGPDSLGLLYRLTRALTDLDIDVRSAKIHTMGVDVVDTFYVVDRMGSKILDPDLQGEIRVALMHALEPTG